jgi:formate dehydrogenase maturation protein FdhE
VPGEEVAPLPKTRKTAKRANRKMRYERNPDWRPWLDSLAQPVAQAKERELYAAISQVIKQVAAEMPGHDVDAILATLRARLSTVLPEKAFRHEALATLLLRDAERISNIAQTPGVRT